MSTSAEANLGAVLAGGGAIGLVFGFVAARTNFCTMGALSDVVNMGHTARLRMWLLALAVAILGAGVLAGLGMVDLSQALAQRTALPWLSLALGGSIFGVGMTLAGGCANKNLVRLGAGSLRSLVVLLVMGLVAYMSMKGLLAVVRAGHLDKASLNLASFGWADAGVGSVLTAFGLSKLTAKLVASAAVALALVAYVFKDARFRANPLQVLGSVALGLCVVAGWWVSGHLGYGENPETLAVGYVGTNSRTLESLSFVAPVAYGLELLLLWTDASLKVSFGICLVLGVVMGSAIAAATKGGLRWEGFADLPDLRRQLLGAVLMGFGGVLAMGCTVGQGLTGLSTLSVGSLIAVAGIVAGCVCTLKWMLARA